MEAQSLAIPLHQIVNVVSLTQAMIFAAFFLMRPARQVPSTWFLVAAFLVMAAVKADQLYQMMGGLEQFPQYGFLLAPIQPAMTPVLYLFVVARTETNFSLKRGYLWHLTPTLLFTLYLFAIYFHLDLGEKVNLIASDGLNTPVNRLVVPLIGDAIQLAYIIAAYRKLEQFGVTLKNWFAHVEDRNLVWLKRLLTVWGCVFILHAAMAILSTFMDTSMIMRTVILMLDIFHLLFINLLALLGAVDFERRLTAQPSMPPATLDRYAGSSLTLTDRAELFRKAEAALTGQALYLRPDLTLNDLAQNIAASPRDVSEAINGAGGQSFYDFVNAARIAHTKTLLLQDLNARVLDIAFQAGFNAKSTFNDAFKKSVGMTPTEYRRQNRSSEKEAPSGAKTA